jgi:quercetin dioxygenase-like cupin family protein
VDISRRDALGAAAIPLLVAALANAQDAQNVAVFAHDLPNVSLANWEVTVRRLTMAPGSVGTAHRHPGFVLVYVLEGSLVARITGSAETTYRAGEMFYEPPGSTHEVHRNASGTMPATFLAFIFAEKGLPLTTPVA